MRDEEKYIYSLAEHIIDIMNLDINNLSISIKTKDVIGINIRLKDIDINGYSPSVIELSYDSDAGYFMNFDNINWEFDHNKILFENTIEKYIIALRDNNLYIKTTRLFKIIKLKDEVKIKK